MKRNNENLLDIQKIKTIVVLDETKKIRLCNNCVEWICNPEILILNIEKIPDYFQDTETYKKIKNYLTYGEVLVQNPYDKNLYTPITNKDIKSIFLKNALEKTTIFSQMCQFLGVKEVHVIEGEKSRESKEKVGNFGLKHQAVNANVKLTQEIYKEVRECLEQKTTYCGSSANIKKAKDYIESKNLSNDHTFTSLIEARSDEQNPITSKLIKMSFLQDTNKSLGVAVGIKFPSYIGIFDISAQYNKITKEQKEIQVSIEVKF